MELDADTRSKFDAVLARVKEGQSELSLAELGMVKKISYHKNEKTIIAYLNIQEPRLECMACAAVNGYLADRVSQDLKAELEAEFPGWTIEVR